MWTDRRRSLVCLGVTVVVLSWAVLAFGTPRDFESEGDVIITEDDVVFVDGDSYPVRTIAAWLTGVGAAICLVLLPGQRRVSRVPLALTMAAGFLLLYGWFMVANARSDHSLEEWVFTEVKNRFLPWAPGSIVRADSLGAMIELSMVLLALWAAVRTGEGSLWRGILGVIAFSGVVVALVGIFHKAAGAPAVYFMEDASQPGETFFAPFVYNANAGAYMNLCLALAIGFALSHVADERRRAQGIFWTLVSVILIAAVIVAASKGAIITLGLTVVISLSWNFHRVRLLKQSFLRERGRKIERVALLTTLVVILGVLAATGITYAVKRWEEMRVRLDDPTRADITGRFEIMKLMARMASAEEGSWHGYGPGAFKHLTPYFTADGKSPDSLDGRWIYGHCDPLQTAVEWGWIGAAAWFVIGGGAVVSGVLLLRRRNLLKSNEVPLMRGAVLGLLMLGLHSCQDFPLSIYSIHLAAVLVCGVCWGVCSNRFRGAKAGEQQ